MGQISLILRKLLIESLDADIFAISNSRPSTKDFTSQCTLVLQGTEDIDQSKWSQIIRSPPHSGSVVVVDRTADVVNTAEIISDANFAFRGESPYSPRVVLVNEYICDQLLSALAAHMNSSRSSIETRLAHPKEDGELTSTRRQQGKIGTKKANVREIVSGSNGSIFELLGR